MNYRVVITGVSVFLLSAFSMAAGELKEPCAEKILETRKACKNADMGDAVEVNACSTAYTSCYRACGDVIDGATKEEQLKSLINRVSNIAAGPKRAIYNCRNEAKPFLRDAMAACSGSAMVGMNNSYCTGSNAADIEMSKVGTLGGGIFEKEPFSDCMVQFMGQKGPDDSRADALLTSLGGACGDAVCSKPEFRVKPYCPRGGDGPPTTADPSDPDKMKDEDYDKLKKMAEDLKKKQDELAKQQKKMQKDMENGGGGGGGGGLGGGGGGGGGGGLGQGVNVSGSSNGEKGGFGGYSPTVSKTSAFEVDSNIEGIQRGNLNDERLNRNFVNSLGPGPRKPGEGGDGGGQGGGGNNAGLGGNPGGGVTGGGRQAPQGKKKPGGRPKYFVKERAELGGHNYLDGGGGGVSTASYEPDQDRPQRGKRSASGTTSLSSSSSSNANIRKIKNVLNANYQEKNWVMEDAFGASTNLFSTPSSHFKNFIDRGILDENGDEI